MEPIKAMSEEQFTLLRERQLTMVSTFFDGSLLVRDPDGALWNLGRAGDLLPHIPRQRHRANLADQPEDMTDVPSGH